MNPKYLKLKEALQYLLLISVFMVFLWPSSLGGGSSNYSFVLLVLATIVVKGSLKIPNKNLITIILFYFLIFFISTIYQLEFLKYFDRRVISFVLFMTIFSYAIINISSDMVRAFKIATVILVIYFILVKIEIYFNVLGGEAGGFSAKGNLGNHRYGFVYIFAFWILLLNKSQLVSLNILRMVGIFIIISGLLLTFSRSGIIALVGSLLLYFLNYYIKIKFSIKLFISSIIYIMFMIFFVFLLFKFLPITFKFFDKYLLSIFTVEGFNELLISLYDKNSSEGYRLFLLGKILNFVSLNPFTGSGFLGCWIMFDDLQCSAHSQYHDVLFRTGFFGFLIYIYLLFNIFKYLKTTHRDLFWGFVSILIYGIFHETFKQSHGAFILAFLFGMMITAKKETNFFRNKQTILKKIKKI